MRSWETKEANASEEPGSAKWMVLQVAKWISKNSVQQIFGRPDAKPLAVYRQVAKWISKTVFSRFSADPTPSRLPCTAYKLAET